MSASIVDVPARNCYESSVDGLTAYLEYIKEPGRMIFTHTIVPKQLGGRGIGTRLVQFALDAARCDGDEIVPRCAFVAAYIDKHPEYRDLVVT